VKGFNKNKCDIVLECHFQKGYGVKGREDKTVSFALPSSPTSIPFVFKHKLNLLSPQSIMWDRTLWCLTWVQTISISQNSLLSVIATELKSYYGSIFLVNFREKWVRFETKEQKSLKFHFIRDFWWPILIWRPRDLCHIWES